MIYALLRVEFSTSRVRVRSLAQLSLFGRIDIFYFRPFRGSLSDRTA